MVFNQGRVSAAGVVSGGRDRGGDGGLLARCGGGRYVPSHLAEVWPCGVITDDVLPGTAAEASADTTTPAHRASADDGV